MHLYFPVQHFHFLNAFFVFSWRKLLAHLSPGHNRKLSLLKLQNLGMVLSPYLLSQSTILQMNSSLPSAPWQQSELCHCHLVTFSDTQSLEARYNTFCYW